MDALQMSIKQLKELIADLPDDWFLYTSMMALAICQTNSEDNVEYKGMLDLVNGVVTLNDPEVEDPWVLWYQ